jgi:hypothetical protein
VPVEIVSPAPPNTVAAPPPTVTAWLPPVALMFALPFQPARLILLPAAPMTVALAVPPAAPVIVSPAPLNTVSDPLDPSTTDILPNVALMNARATPAEITSPTPPNTVARPPPSVTVSLPASALIVALPNAPLRSTRSPCARMRLALAVLPATAVIVSPPAPLPPSWL